MKKLGFLLPAFMLATLLSGSAFAQGNKTTNCFTMEKSFDLPCVIESVYGIQEVCITNWEDGKVQWKIKGTYVGKESGLTYTHSAVQNEIWKDYVPGQAYNRTFMGTASLECDGIPIGVFKYRYHFTINANGELTVDNAESIPWVCF